MKNIRLARMLVEHDLYNGPISHARRELLGLVVGEYNFLDQESREWNAKTAQSAIAWFGEGATYNDVVEMRRRFNASGPLLAIA